MEENIENPGETTDNTKKADVVQRHPDSEVLYIGCKDAVAVDLIKSVLGQKFRVFVLNKNIFNIVTENMIKTHRKWEQDQLVLEYTKDPENMHESLKIAKRVEDKVGAGNWFTLSQFMDETSFTYKHAHSTMDLLFAFGFLAEDTKNKKYLIVADPRVKLKYVEDIEAQMQDELEKFSKIKEMMRTGIVEAEFEIQKVVDQLNKEGKEAIQSNTEISEDSQYTPPSPEVEKDLTEITNEKPVKKRAPRKKKETDAPKAKGQEKRKKD